MVSGDFSGAKVFRKEGFEARGFAGAERRGGKVVFFKWGLAAYDCLLALAGWMVFTWMYESAVTEDYLLSGWVSLFFSAVLTIVFFPSYRLYSHHLIFSRVKHIGSALKALFSASGCFALLSLYYALSGKSVLIVVLLAVMIAFVLSKSAARATPYAHYHIFRLIGICLLAAGFLEYINQGRALAIVREPLFVAIGFVFSACIVLVARLVLVHAVFNDLLRRRFRRQVAVIGTDGQARGIVDHVLAHNAPFWVAGVVGRTGPLDSQVAKQCLGPVEKLPELVERYGIDELIVTDRKIDKRTLIYVLDYCLSCGIAVWLQPNLLPIIDQKLHINHFCGLPMVKLCANHYLWLYDKAKGLLDWVLAGPAILILMPLFGLIALAVRMTSKGPVLYKSPRIGKDGSVFDMLKFRTMHVGSDHAIHKEFVTRLIKGDMQVEEGGTLKIVDDPRITPVGAFLRKTSLDEIPQLFNVIRGEMSLVGPRPCLPYEFEVYQEWYKKRTCVRPGITGMWQVAGRSEVAFEDMILLDLYYIYNRGLWLDLNILIETVFVLLDRRGAY